MEKRGKDAVIFSNMYSGSENTVKLSHSLSRRVKSDACDLNSSVLLNTFSVLSPSSGGQNKPSAKLLLFF